MTMIFAAALLAGTVLWVLGPLLGWGGAEELRPPAAAEQEGLLEARRQTLASMKDLDMEYRLGKLTPEDYQETRERLAREAVDILKQIDAGGGAPEPADRGGRGDA